MSKQPEIVINREDILKEGWLVKQSRTLKDWRRRWFVLTAEHLCTFKSPDDLRTPTESIRLKDCSTVKSADDDTGKENSFRVDTQERSYFVIADSAQEKEAWIGHVGKQMVRRTVITEDDDDEDDE